MKTEKIQPGYRVTGEVHEIVKSYAKELSGQLGFHVSVNKAVELLIKRGHESVTQEPQRG